MVMRNKVKELRWVPASELQKNPKNWRRHPDSQRAALHGTVDQIGFTTPLQVRELPDGSLELIDGHLRLEEFGDETLPVVVVDLTEAEAAVALATHDPLAMMAVNDTDSLLALLQETEFDSKVVSELLEAVANGERFPMPDLTQPTGSDAEDPGADIDKADELQEKWQTERGQVWEVGRHRLMCGDATAKQDVEQCLAGNVPLLMVTDPPYGVNYDPGWRQGLVPNHPQQGAIGAVTNDDRAEWRDAWVLFPGDVAYVWSAPGPLQALSGANLLAADFEIRTQIIWAKSSFVIGRGHYHYQHEPCWYAVKKGRTGNWIGDRSQATIWAIDRPVRNDTGHATQKPVECMARPIRNHAGNVYDPFLGSGTTMVAAEQLGRICYGMEIEPKYVAVTLERMSGMGLEPKLVE